MKTLAALSAEVAAVLQNGGVTGLTIKPKLNEGYRVVCARKGFVTADVTDDVVAGTGAVTASMPSNYSHGLSRVVNITAKNEVDIYSDVATLKAEYGIPETYNSDGSVYACTVSGATLNFIYSPTSAETLTLYYKAAPAEMGDSDTPGLIPEAFADQVLTAYALQELFAKQEDGIDGAKINTSFWAARFEQIMREIDSFLRSKTSFKYSRKRSGWI